MANSRTISALNYAFFTQLGKEADFNKQLAQKNLLKNGKF
jgi:hypothetical protein